MDRSAEKLRGLPGIMGYQQSDGKSHLRCVGELVAFLGAHAADLLVVTSNAKVQGQLSESVDTCL